jgi:hypothetical protein
VDGLDEIHAVGGDDLGRAGGEQLVLPLIAGDGAGHGAEPVGDRMTSGPPNPSNTTTRGMAERRRLQRYGLVERRTEAPRLVEYGLTDLGRTLVGPIEVLTDWAREHGGAVAAFQEATETMTSAEARPVE